MRTNKNSSSRSNSSNEEQKMAITQEVGKLYEQTIFKILKKEGLIEE